jgi:hypothetical protein
MSQSHLLSSRWTPNGTLVREFADPDKNGQIVQVRTFNYEHIKDACTRDRIEGVHTPDGPRLAMRIPVSLFYELMRKGKLGEEAMTTGKVVVDAKKLAELQKEYSAFNCED